LRSSWFRANRKLTEAAASLPDVEVVHLDGLCADGEIELEREVVRLIAAQRIVLQFPVQWYSTPPPLKVWQDRLLTRMFYASDFQAVSKWVSSNADALMDYYDGNIDTAQLVFASCQSLGRRSGTALSSI
jgi:putative NADPH-quinone reductase